MDIYTLIETIVGVIVFLPAMLLMMAIMNAVVWWVMPILYALRLASPSRGW